MTKRLVAPLASLAVAVAACGGLDSPDLTTGAVAGRVYRAWPGARAYVLGRPEVRADLDGRGQFFLAPVPVGAAEVVVFDGNLRAGRLAAVVHGADVTWVGPAPALQNSDRPAGPSGPSGEPGQPPVGSDEGSGLPLAGAIVARATADGLLVDGVRFDVEGTDQLGVAPAASGDALLAPLPPGAYELVARAEGFAEARRAVVVEPGMTVAVELPLARE